MGRCKTCDERSPEDCRCKGDAQSDEVRRLREALTVLSKASWDAVDVRCFALDALGNAP